MGSPLRTTGQPDQPRVRHGSRARSGAAVLAADAGPAPRRKRPSATASETAAEHQRIAAAIAAGHPEGATEAMRAHLTAAGERHLPAFDRLPASGAGSPR